METPGKKFVIVFRGVFKPNLGAEGGREFYAPLVGFPLITQKW